MLWAEDTQGALWRGTAFPANGQHQLSSYVSEPPWKQVLHPQSHLQMIAAPPTVLSANP